LRVPFIGLGVTSKNFGKCLLTANQANHERSAVIISGEKYLPEQKLKRSWIILLDGT
jgi:hypothetical protein